MPFCANCGKEYSGNETFCPSCGKQIAVSSGSPPPMPSISSPPSQIPTRISRPAGITILAILQIFGSVVMLITGLVVTVFGPFGLAIVAIGALSLIFALALFTGRNWARILMMVGAVLDIISIVGIIWGIILLWYLTRPHVVAYFKQPK